MKSEAIFNHKGEPTITVYPETEEEKSILSTMLGKAKGEDGNHALVMGCFKVDDDLESCTFTTNPIGHPTTFRYRI